jgi:DNA replication protein DnaC
VLVEDVLERKSFARFCKCREQRITESKLKFANIPEEFKSLTINSFRVDWYTTDESRARAALAKKAAANFVKNFEKMKEIGKGLYFYSYVKGSGKTRLAASIANALVNVHQADVKFSTTTSLLSEIRRTFNPNSKVSSSELIDAIKTVDVIVLDDIGTEKPTDWVNEIFYEILNERMIQKKITIFTSNAKIEELNHDDRIKNRIEKMAVPVYLPDESIRSFIAKKENEALQSLLFE